MTLSVRLMTLVVGAAGLVGAHAQDSSKAPDADKTQLEGEALIVMMKNQKRFLSMRRVRCRNE